MKYIFIALFLIPFLFRFFFWSYIFQLKEYRFDRLKEYLGTPQGKKAIFSKIVILEILILILGILSFFNENVLIEYYLFFLVIILNFIYIYKIFKNQYFLPKLSFRFTLIYLLSFFLLILISEYFFHYLIFSLILVFPQILIFTSNFLVLPIINLGKSITIRRAKNKSKNINKVLKIGITGSYGKSSVKEYLSYLLSEYGKTLSTPENINTEIGVSKIILKKLNVTYDFFVAEMGAYKIGEIKFLGEIVNHKHGFLTAIGTQHIGLFGSQENIKIGKSEIALKTLENNGYLYVNWNNDNIRDTNILNNLNNIIKYGNITGCDATYEIISFNDGFLEFKFIYRHINSTFKTNLLGEHNILNLTGVLAFLVDLNFDLEKVKEKLLTIPKPKHTLDVIKNNDLILIDDTYNLSVDGLLAGIDTLKYFQGKKILILDDILELGKDSDKIHFELGEKIGKSKSVDKIFYIGTNYKKPFYNGLKYSFFAEENIINNLENIDNNSILLFEGRGARKYFNGLL